MGLVLYMHKYKEMNIKSGEYLIKCLCIFFLLSINVIFSFWGINTNICGAYALCTKSLTLLTSCVTIHMCTRTCMHPAHITSMTHTLTTHATHQQNVTHPMAAS